MRQLDLDFHHMDLAEAPHRGYNNVAELFSDVHVEDPAIEQCKRAFTRLLGELRPDVCMGPMGVGGHVDHRVVVASLEAALCDSDTKACLYYADQPYALKHPDELNTLCSASNKVTPLHFHSERSTRQEAIDAIAAYTTQLGFQFGGEEKMRKTLQALMSPGIRFWHREARLDALEPFLASHSSLEQAN